MIKYFFTLVILLQISLNSVAQANANVKYFFHWSNENRHKMLVGYRNLRKQVSESVFGTGAQGGLSSINVAGRGLYIADDPKESRVFGPNLTIVAVPSDAELRLYSKSHGYYVVSKANPGIRFLTVDEFIRIYETMQAGSILNNRQTLSLRDALISIERIDLLSRVDQHFQKLNGFSISSFVEDLNVVGNRSRMIEYHLKNRNSRMPRLGIDSVLALQFFDREHLNQALQSAVQDPSLERLRQLGAAPSDLYEFLSSGNAPSEATYRHSRTIEALIPKDLYGADAFEAFRQSTLFVRANAYRRPLQFQDLSEIHKLAYPSSAGEYKSFLFNQIQKASRSVREEAQRQMDLGNFSEVYQILRIERPDGVLRDGEIYISSSSQNLDGTRNPFTSEELNVLRQNPNLSVREDRGVVRFNYHLNFRDQIDELLRSTFQRADQLKSSYYSNRHNNNAATEAYFLTATDLAARFYLEIVSRHPFWDGSGRAAKLARDWLLLYLNLQPPLSTPSNDMTMGLENLIEDLRREVNKSMAIGNEITLFAESDLMEFGPSRDIKELRKQQLQSQEQSASHKLGQDTVLDNSNLYRNRDSFACHRLF